jgi:hypothetical protein
MAELEDFDDIDQAVEGEVIPEDYQEQPGWGKALAWGTIVLGGLYIINPTAGVFELIPDVVPVLGNLDEAALMFLIFGAMRYLGWTLPEFIERWTQPRARLTSGQDEQD